jgi:alkyl hydroperoxide reductase subunit AhpC
MDEISAAGIREVVVFHSTATELRKYQSDMAFPVIGDSDKTLYRRFGVEASARAVLKQLRRIIDSSGSWLGNVIHG